MKHFLLSAAVILLFLVPLNGRCAEEDGFVYSVVNGRTIITGYTGEPEFIEIPQAVESCAVIGIADRAFYGCRSLKRVTFPPTLRKIGENSFYACYSLEEVSIPKGTEKLGKGSFCGCTSLKSISIPETITEIPESCFRACPQLNEVNIPCTVKRIGNYAFSGCTGLERVTLGEELSEIGERAFFMCGRLEKMYIPSSLTLIEKEAIGYVPSNAGASPMAGFSLSGKKNSVAQRYAESSGIPFVQSADIIRRSDRTHLTKASQKVSEKCIIATVILLIAALADTAKKLRRKRRS